MHFDILKWLKYGIGILAPPAKRWLKTHSFFPAEGWLKSPAHGWLKLFFVIPALCWLKRSGTEPWLKFQHYSPWQRHHACHIVAAATAQRWRKWAHCTEIWNRRSAEQSGTEGQQKV